MAVLLSSVPEVDESFSYPNSDPQVVEGVVSSMLRDIIYLISLKLLMSSGKVDLPVGIKPSCFQMKCQTKPPIPAAWFCYEQWKLVKHIL